MGSNASWQLTHGQRPRECEVSRYRHGCDPPELADPVLDCDTAPFSQRCVSDPPFLRPYPSPMPVLQAEPARVSVRHRAKPDSWGDRSTPPDWAKPICFYVPGRA